MRPSPASPSPYPLIVRVRMTVGWPLWAVADAGTQALIAQAHHETVVAVVAFMECEVAAIRTGATAGDGAVAQVDVTGLITSIPAPGTRTCIRMW